MWVKATSAEAELTAASGQSITSASLVTVDPGYSLAATTSSSSTASSSVHSAVLASSISSSGSTCSVAARAVTGTIHTREEWWVKGNPTMTWKPDRTATWKGAVIHHTDGVNDYSQKEVPAIINGIYIFHCRTRGWGDIGYNLLVDKYGGIWEGRDEGVANMVVRASEVVAVHTKSFNSVTFGVAMLGDFQGSTAPTEVQMKGVAAAIAWGFQGLGITSPYGTFQYYGTQQRISGHGDESHRIARSDGYNVTQCPGNQVSSRMGHIRSLVAGDFHDITHRSAVSLSDGTYYISWMLDESMAVDIADGSKDRGARTQLYRYNHTAAQQYSFSRNADGSYTITNVGSGKVLDVRGGQAEDGAMVSQWDANGTDAQKWYVRDAGNGYVIQSALGNWVLDVDRASTANRTSVRLYSSNDSRAQRFLLSSVSTSTPTNGTVRVASAADGGLVADIPGGSTSRGSRLQLYPWNSSDAQIYTLREVGNSIVEIVSQASGLALDVKDASTANKVQVRQWTVNHTAAQRWAMLDDGDGKASLLNGASGKALDVPGSHAATKVKLQSYANNGTTAQQWVITRQRTQREVLDDLASGHRADVTDGSKADGADVRLWAWNGSGAQRWRFTHDSKGYVTVTNAGSGKVLGISGGRASQKADVVQETNRGASGSPWRAATDPSPSCRPPSSDFALDVYGAHTTRGHQHRRLRQERDRRSGLASAA